MFSRATDASKVCLVHLVNHLRARGYALLDVQLPSAHMSRFGTVQVPRERFLEQLGDALGRPATWGRVRRYDTAACAAASRAIGTLNGEQLT